MQLTLFTDEPLNERHAAAAARRAMRVGTITLSRQALLCVTSMGMSTQDVVNIIRGGAPISESGESGTFRLSTKVMEVVFRLETPGCVKIVAAQRYQEATCMQ